MHLLQVCNVGNICGGTAACAWSITRALPACRHTVLFLSRPTDETRRAFAPVAVEFWPRVDTARAAAVDPDVVLLHNTTADRCDRLRAPLTIQYLHSRITPAAANLTVACSDWLRRQLRREEVEDTLYQPVDVPHCSAPSDVRSLRDRLSIGRICTPQSRKWPRELIPFYAERSERHPQVDWEFVGCPAELVESLRTACQGRARFLPAEWTARRHLHRWDAMLYHHPTLTESFGRTVAESLLAGCIPIVDDRGGFREQLGSGTGFLCRHATDFDTALARLHSPADRHAMSRAAQTAGYERFSGPAFTNRFRALLEAAVMSIA